jgi:hypothetical protein
MAKAAARTRDLLGFAGKHAILAAENVTQNARDWLTVALLAQLS